MNIKALHNFWIGRLISLKIFSGGLLLFILCLTAYSQIDTPLRFSFKAKLADANTGNPIIFANIYNLNLKVGTISDTTGTFTIQARYNDVLLISCIGYYVKNVQITDTLIKQIFLPYIFLSEKAYELGKVDIHFLGTYQDFKYRILHSKLPDNRRDRLNKKLQEELDKQASQLLQEKSSISIGGPISAIYSLFSKEAKSLRKLADAKEQESIQSIIDLKFNREIIEKITGLKGEKLDDFILYCQPDKSILLKSDEFQIYRLIQSYYERYKQINNSDSASVHK